MRLQKCKHCMYYTAYYKRWCMHFERLNLGFCIKHQRQQVSTEACESFKTDEQREQRQYQSMLASLERALNSVNDISQILREKHGDS